MLGSRVPGDFQFRLCHFGHDTGGGERVVERIGLGVWPGIPWAFLGEPRILPWQRKRFSFGLLLHIIIWSNYSDLTRVLGPQMAV